MVYQFSTYNSKNFLKSYEPKRSNFTINNPFSKFYLLMLASMPEKTSMLPNNKQHKDHNIFCPSVYFSDGEYLML